MSPERKLRERASCLFGRPRREPRDSVRPTTPGSRLGLPRRRNRGRPKAERGRHSRPYGTVTRSLGFHPIRWATAVTGPLAANGSV